MLSFVRGLMGAPGTSSGRTTVILTLEGAPGAVSSWVASLLNEFATPWASCCARVGDGSVTLMLISDVSRGALALTLDARAPAVIGRPRSSMTVCATLGLETKLT